MTDSGMRPRRARPPGFAQAGPSPPAVPERAPEPPVPAPLSRAPYRGAPVRQLNVRLLEPLHQRYRTLLRDLHDSGEPTSMTELVHALLHAGPASADEARTLVERWRDACRRA